MPVLILLNGPPASGKSTLADRLVRSRDLALNLDIDVLRGQLGRWEDQPADAGSAARTLAIEMAGIHLDAGHDVVVPQFLGRSDFIETLDRVAVAHRSTFVEVGLMLDRQVAIDAFHARSAKPEQQTHRDASVMVDRSTSPDPVGEMYDAFRLVLERRPTTVRVTVVRDDVDSTLDGLVRALEAVGLHW